MWLFVVNMVVFILYFSVLQMHEQIYDCMNRFMIAWKLIRILVGLATFSVLLPMFKDINAHLRGSFWRSNYSTQSL